MREGIGPLVLVAVLGVMILVQVTLAQRCKDHGGHWLYREGACMVSQTIPLGTVIDTR